jgi:hypothetical protein
MNEALGGFAFQTFGLLWMFLWTGYHVAVVGFLYLIWQELRQLRMK